MQNKLEFRVEAQLSLRLPVIASWRCRNIGVPEASFDFADPSGIHVIFGSDPIQEVPLSDALLDDRNIYRSDRVRRFTAVAVRLHSSSHDLSL
jgi:hypothetical protein